MKNLITFFITILFLTGCSPQLHTDIYVTNKPSRPVTQPPTPRPSNSFQVFYDELSPYGSWMNYPDYGYVWRPNVGPDFRPYATNGHWVYSDADWMWVSNYPWGWAAFHYGRWFYENGYGWLWLPGHQWAPAWVTWGRSGEYYGWAPLAPRIEVDVRTGGGWTPPNNSWTFVPRQHITKPDVVKYVVVNDNKTVINTITKNVTIINNVTTNNVNNNRVTNNIVYNRGPVVKEVENVTNTKINAVIIKENSKPGGTTITNNNLIVFRPQIKPNTPTDVVKPAPKNTMNYMHKEN